MFNNLATAWSEMSPSRRIGALAGLSIIALTVLLIGRLAMAPGYALLYGNLGSSQAGEVVAELDRLGARYQVRGDAIYVEQPRRDELRLQLASEGLPANSVAGYELLDELTGFGTTSQMFDAAQARAIEGELARTIVASAFVREARVHIARSGNTPFQVGQGLSASVFVRPSGFELSSENAKALKYLVASAMAGLSVEDVAVIDSNTGKLLDETDLLASASSSSNRGDILRENVVRLLEAHVGRGNAKVQLHLETETDTESILERRFDPEGRVAVSTDTLELSSSSSGPAGGAVTVASNVPSGDAANGGGESSSQDTELRERTNFEVSEIQREIQKAPGKITRLTVAVLVNGVADENNEGVWRPRSEGELQDLRELVESAVGYRDDRGDVITIKSLQFEEVLPQGSGPTGGMFDFAHLDLMSIIQLAILSLVAIVLGLFVVKPIFTRAPVAALENQGSDDSDTLDLPEIVLSDGDNSESEPSTLEELPALPPLGGMDSPMATVGDFDLDGNFSQDTDSVDKLKSMIEERQTDTVEILRNWLEEPEATEGAA